MYDGLTKGGLRVFPKEKNGGAGDFVLGFDEVEFRSTVRGSCVSVNDRLPWSVALRMYVRTASRSRSASVLSATMTASMLWPVLCRCISAISDGVIWRVMLPDRR